jgi:hypothetical protein
MTEPACPSANERGLHRLLAHIEQLRQENAALKNASNKWNGRADARSSLAGRGPRVSPC